MQPSRPGSPLPSASQASLPPQTESSPRSSGMMSPATPAMYDAGGHPEESMQLWEIGVPPRLLNFLQREPSIFTPWNLPHPEQGDGHASVEVPITNRHHGRPAPIGPPRKPQPPAPIGPPRRPQPPAPIGPPRS
ncbi:unnamed protein product [Victoria cruziana]